MTTNGNNPINLEAGGAMEAVRLNQQKRLKNILISRKSSLTKDVKNCKEKLDLFEANFDDDDSPYDNQIEDAIDIIHVYSRAKTRFQYLESGIEELRALICDNYEATEEEIQKDIDKLDAELNLYEKRLSEIKKNHSNVLGRCKSVMAKSQTKATDRTRINVNPPTATSNNTFKPQTDLKPVYLAKDCTLLEYNTFGKTFISYMQSSQSAIPLGAVDTNIRVHVDPWWYIELKEKGLNNNSKLESLPGIMELVALEKFPIHQRRMKVFKSEQKGDTK